VVQVEEEVGTTLKRTIPITVLSDGSIKLQTMTDKESYSPGESVQVTNMLENTSQNEPFEQVQVVNRWLNEDGTVRTFQQEELNLPVGARQDISFTFDQGGIEPGTYTIQTEVSIAGEIVISEEITITIEETSGTYVGLVGELEIPAKTYYLGQEIPITYSLTNNGNVDLQDVNAELLIIDPKSEAIIQQVSTPLDLLVVDTKGFQETISTLDLSVGEYLVTLQVLRPDGEWMNLASTGFIIEVGLKADMTLNSSNPRVLLWSEQNDQRITDVVEELDAYVHVVDREQEFIEELRSGLYNVFILQDSKRPLTAHYDQELLAKLHSGQGLIVTEQFKLADFWAYDVFQKEKGNSGNKGPEEDWSIHEYGLGQAAYLTGQFLELADQNPSTFQSEMEQILYQTTPRAPTNNAGESVQYVITLEAQGTSLDTRLSIPLPNGFHVLHAGDFELQEQSLQWNGTVAVDTPTVLTFIAANPGYQGSYTVKANPEFLTKEQWVSNEPVSLTFDVVQGREELFSQAIYALEQSNVKQGKGQIENTRQKLIDRQQEPAQTNPERELLIDSIVKSLELLTKDDTQVETRLTLERLLGYIQQNWFLEGR
jgi:hypothetical protein